ncbi:O-antigen ligase domain-containing protein [Williamsia sp.]|uniref:O-antigen ligase family protein n=1 Tax=Williamsia sp. TaxID=1872085 RepID=UPI001A2C2FCD|nr:O-antigen ligase domain-containing protein [Williamsia sp.]MBJ7289143.1 O-antigen ligase domain-containing protein [Williamsia sp.]
MIGPLIVVLAAAGAFGSILLGGSILIAALAGLALIVGVFVGLRHPTWLLWATAGAAGLFPAGYLPGVHVPMVFSLAMGFLLATLVHPVENKKISTMEWFVIALLLMSFLSLVVTAGSPVDIMEFVKWAAAVSLVIALMRLPRSQVFRFGQVYVCATTLSGLLAMGIVFGDPAGKVLKSLSILGYGTEAESTRYVYSGDKPTARLAGTFLDPNAAGIGILVALLICVIVFAGWTRFVLGGILLVCLILTLSRASLFALVFGVVMMLVFQSLSVRQRTGIIATFVLGFCAALSVPQIRNRLLTSFSSQDTGSSARLDAIRDFPGALTGRWIFGRGWGLPEFKDPALAFTTNFVANAPLLSVYRGGVLVGITFVIGMLYSCTLGYRCLRSDQWNLGLYGGSFIGFFLITMQLDIGTVTIPVSTAGLSFLLVFLIHASDMAKESSTKHSSPDHDLLAVPPQPVSR